jgi:ADP-ribosylglycohydrolase
MCQSKCYFFKVIEINDSGNTTHPNPRNIASAIVRAKFITINAYIKKVERFQVNNLIFLLQGTRKTRINHTKISTRKEIIKIRMEINESIKQHERSVK